MPIVRIDLEGKSDEYRAQVGEIVYQTLVDVLNVPKDGRFHVITEHRKSAVLFDRDYLGVYRTDDCIFFQGVKLSKEDVFINLVDVPKRIGHMEMDWPITFLADLSIQTYQDFLKIAAALGGASTVGTLPNLAGAQDTPQQTDTPAITLQDVPSSSGAKLTIERRGQIVLFGINRLDIQNRIDPETFEKLAEAYYQYDHDPSLRAAILFGHGEKLFQEVSTLKDLSHSQGRASLGSRALGR